MLLHLFPTNWPHYMLLHPFPIIWPIYMLLHPFPTIWPIYMLLHPFPPFRQKYMLIHPSLLFFFLHFTCHYTHFSPHLQFFHAETPSTFSAPLSFHVETLMFCHFRCFCEETPPFSISSFAQIELEEFFFSINALSVRKYCCIITWFHICRFTVGQPKNGLHIYAPLVTSSFLTFNGHLIIMTTIPHGSHGGWIVHLFRQFGLCGKLWGTLLILRVKVMYIWKHILMITYRLS